MTRETDTHYFEELVRTFRKSPDDVLEEFCRRTEVNFRDLRAGRQRCMDMESRWMRLDAAHLKEFAHIQRNEVRKRKKRKGSTL